MEMAGGGPEGGWPIPGIEEIGTEPIELMALATAAGSRTSTRVDSGGGTIEFGGTKAN